MMESRRCWRLPARLRTTLINNHLGRIWVVLMILQEFGLRGGACFLALLILRRTTVLPLPTIALLLVELQLTGPVVFAVNRGHRPIRLPKSSLVSIHNHLFLIFLNFIFFCNHRCQQSVLLGLDLVQAPRRVQHVLGLFRGWST